MVFIAGSSWDQLCKVECDAQLNLCTILLRKRGLKTSCKTTRRGEAFGSAGQHTQLGSRMLRPG